MSIDDILHVTVFLAKYYFGEINVAFYRIMKNDYKTDFT